MLLYLAMNSLDCLCEFYPLVPPVQKASAVNRIWELFVRNFIRVPVLMSSVTAFVLLSFSVMTLIS